MNNEPATEVVSVALAINGVSASKQTSLIQSAEHPASKFYPRLRMTDPNFVWVPACQTDVRRTWERFGWKPIHDGKSA